MDDQMQASISGELELQRRLDAYASVRLSATPRADARMRARVMREARLAFAARADSPGPVGSIGSIDVTRTRRRADLFRRGGGLLLAAGLSLGVAGGAMAAAQAGGPLYPTRMWLETITLPTDGGGRTDAEIARLETRMVEMMAAARSGDRGAVEAALLAYEEIADDAEAVATGDSAAMDRLRIALDRHLAVLESVAAKVPPQARDSIERNIDRAIEHNAATLERIGATRGGPAANPGGAGTKPGGAANEPAASDNRDKSVKPTPRPTPVRARPEVTPRPAATPHGGGQPKGPPPKPDKTPKGPGR
jgi:hypothetical protein